MNTEWIAMYMQEKGKEPKSAVISIINHIDHVCSLLEERGQIDATEGKEAPSFRSFVALVSKIFGSTFTQANNAADKTTLAIAHCWKDFYMSGYDEEIAKRKSFTGISA